MATRAFPPGVVSNPLTMVGIAVDAAGDGAQTLSDTAMTEYTSEALAALSLLISFRKYEGSNPFVTKAANVASPSLVAVQPLHPGVCVGAHAG